MSKNAFCTDPSESDCHARGVGILSPMDHVAPEQQEVARVQVWRDRQSVDVEWHHVTGIGFIVVHSGLGAIRNESRRAASLKSRIEFRGVFSQRVERKNANVRLGRFGFYDRYVEIQIVPVFLK